ncbi:MAG TPA: hypothetical protein VF532_05430 [Candidatus Angelobacter sp.]
MARLFAFVLLLLALAVAAGFAWTAYHLHQLQGAIANHGAALRQFQVRQEAIFAADSMDTALLRFMLDGNTANTELIRLNKELVERLAQQDDAAKNDKMLQDLVAKEQQWYSQFAQPLIEQRKQVQAGQGLPEDLLNRYRTTKKDLGTFDLEMAAQAAYQRDTQGLLQAQEHLGPGAWLRYAAVALALIAIFAVALGTFRNIGRLHRVAKGEGEVEEDDEDTGPEGEGH